MSETTTSPIDEQRTQEAQEPKTNLYTSSYGEIFRKNFVAGFSRTLGSIILYLLFIGILTYLASSYLLPQLQNFYQSFSPSGSVSPQVDPNQVKQLLNQSQK